MRRALRTEFLVIAALILVSGLVVYGWSVGTPDKTTSVPAIQPIEKAVAAPTPSSTRTGNRALLEWKRNGRTLRRDRAPRGANDVHLRWENRTFVGAQWTRDGDPLGDPIEAPTGANEAEVELNE